jgi:hypothetical protein
MGHGIGMREGLFTRHLAYETRCSRVKIKTRMARIFDLMHPGWIASGHSLNSTIFNPRCDVE